MPDGHTEFEIGKLIFNLFLVIILVLLNGFFVAAEFSLVKVRQSRLTQLVSEGNKRATYALKVNKNWMPIYQPHNWELRWPHLDWAGSVSRPYPNC